MKLKDIIIERLEKALDEAKDLLVVGIFSAFIGFMLVRGFLYQAEVDAEQQKSLVKRIAEENRLDYHPRQKAVKSQKDSKPKHPVSSTTN